MLTKKKALKQLRKRVKALRRLFLVPNYDDKASGWMVEDQIHWMESILREVLGDYDVNGKSKNL